MLIVSRLQSYVKPCDLHDPTTRAVHGAGVDPVDHHAQADPLLWMFRSKRKTRFYSGPHFVG
ncbi:hypothetical protein LCGC14_3026550, partial [marine sediment metagenome]